MNNSLKKIILAFVLSVATALGAFVELFSVILPRSVSQETRAADVALYGSTTLDTSIYMREPTYSVFYNNKIYFIDNGDKMLKIYDTDSHSFDSLHKDLSAYTILDARLCSGELFLLTNNQTKNSVIKIKLDETLVLSEVGSLEINLNYDKFSVSSITVDTTNCLIFTFYSSDTTKNIKPSFALFDFTNSELKINLTEINFDTQISIYNNGIASVMFYSTTSKNYFIFLYKENIILYEISWLTAGEIANFSTTYPSNQLTIQSTSVFNFNDFSAFVQDSEKISSTGFLKIDDDDYLIIGSEKYNAEAKKLEESVEVYELKLASQNTITPKKELECTNAKFAIANDNFLAYTNSTAQTLSYVKFSKSTTSSDLEVLEHEDVENPDCEVSYFDTDNFEYKKVTTATEIYANPWGLSTKIALGVNANVVKIGYGHLSNGTEISNFDYCIYTSSSGNYFGYIENRYLENLEEKTIESAGFKATKDENGASHYYASLWPNASLYSLPTTIQSGKVGSSNLVAERIMQIEDNSFVDVLDVLDDYTAGEVKMFKVKVNGDKIGFIEARCVRTPADIVNFVITNATIKNDGTKVYLTANSDSTTLPFTLNSGKTVRINGKRDTKTGFTSITFNDEYGNEYSGFIETDYIKADSWSTLQIVGCILIAINIGLLILILIFKKNHLGSHGQKVGEDEIITK